MPRKPLKDLSMLISMLIDELRIRGLPGESDVDGWDMWEMPVTVTGINKRQNKPIKSFEAQLLSARILQNVKSRKHNRLTPIQKYALPIIKLRRDVMGCAPTGTGKTIAYLLPVLDYIEKNHVLNAKNGRLHPSALVIVPTRELAIQIYDEACFLIEGTKVSAGLACGGINFQHTKNSSGNRCDLLIATPGRLKAMLKDGDASLDKCVTLILDEADRMLEMGFEGDVRSIVRKYGLPSNSDRQTLMFSDTFPKPQQELAKDFMHNYVFIHVGSVGEANQDIDQDVREVHKSEKLETLKGLVQEYKADDKHSKVKVLVFVRAKATAESLLRHFDNANTINSNMSQNKRNQALNDFKSGSINILIATDVASRGLDIPNVDLVINYDLPNKIEVYVQRIGRTGRVGQKGLSISFYDRTDSCDKAVKKKLIQCLSKAHQRVPPFLLRDVGHTGSLASYIHKAREEQAWTH